MLRLRRTPTSGRSIALVLTVALTLLLPGLASALVDCVMAECAVADCPMQEGSGAAAHDCCPPAPSQPSISCCEHAPAARAAAPVLPERVPTTTTMALLGGVAAPFGELPAASRSLLSDWRPPRPPLDCLARTCALRQ